MGPPTGASIKINRLADQTWKRCKARRRRPTNVPVNRWHAKCLSLIGLRSPAPGRSSRAKPGKRAGRWWWEQERAARMRAAPFRLGVGIGAQRANQVHHFGFGPRQHLRTSHERDRTRGAVSRRFEARNLKAFSNNGGIHISARWRPNFRRPVMLYSIGKDYSVLLQPGA